MIFEVPVDHFPAQHDRTRRPTLLLPLFTKTQRRNDVSANVEVLSPSARQSQFTFPTPFRRGLPDTSLPRVVSISSLTRPVHSSASRLTVAKIFSLPMQVFSFRIPLLHTS